MLGLFLVFYYEYLCIQRDKETQKVQEEPLLNKPKPKGYYRTIFELPMDQKHLYMERRANETNPSKR